MSKFNKDGFNIGNYYVSTSSPLFDEYVNLSLKQYGGKYVDDLLSFKEKGFEYVCVCGPGNTPSWDRGQYAYKTIGKQEFTSQHIKEPVMNDKIMEAVVALNGDLSNVVNHHIDINNAISLFSDGDGYWLTISTFEELCNCDRAKKMDLTPICTVAEFEDAAAQWKAAQPKPQEVNTDVIPFKLESGKHAVKMADGTFGIVLGDYVVYEYGYDPLLAVMGDIVEVMVLSRTEKCAPILGYGFQHVYDQADELYSVWKKSVKTPQQLHIERLQKILVDTQAELDKLTNGDTGGLNE